MCSDAIYSAKYDDLVAGCLEVVNDDDLRKSLQLKAINSISKYP